MPRLARSRYSQRYSLGGSSDAASGYQSTVRQPVYITFSFAVDPLRRATITTGVRRMNDVNARRARLVLGSWIGDRLRAGIPSRYVTSQLG